MRALRTILRRVLPESVKRPMRRLEQRVRQPLRRFEFATRYFLKRVMRLLARWPAAAVGRRSFGEHAESRPSAEILGYQELDWEIVDYKLYRFPGLPLDLRGPGPQGLDAGRHIACVGAAQTFGRFCPEPFPGLLSQRLGIPVVNLGFAGAGPRFFLRHPRLIQCMNEARFVILQVMSARSEDNAMFDSGGLEFLTIRSTGERMEASRAYGRLLESGDIRLVKSIIAETRANWLASYERLLSQIRVPTVLLWFSIREPDYSETYEHVRGLFGAFPDLVDREMAEFVRTRCDAYVHCVTDRGLPQQLTNRFTGRPAPVQWRQLLAGWSDLGRALQTHQGYYPSPEMHGDAADSLEPVCRGFLDRRDQPNLGVPNSSDAEAAGSE